LALIFQQDLLHDFITVHSGQIAGLDPATSFLVEPILYVTYWFQLPCSRCAICTFLWTELDLCKSCDFFGASFNIRRDTVFDTRLGFLIETRTSPDKDIFYRFSLPCIPPSRETSGNALRAVPNPHTLLGHPAPAVVRQVAKSNPLYVDTLKSASNTSTCKACARGKATHALPKTPTTSRSSVNAPLELIHSDVCGPLPQLSLTKDLYYVVFVDDYTHMFSAYPIKQKSDVYECVRTYLLQSERFFHNCGGYKPIALRTDNGGEYMSQLQPHHC